MTTGGIVLSPISTPISSVCNPELITKEDLFLLYAEHFFPWDINPAGMNNIYGVYDSSAGETENMCLGIDDRQSLMRGLMFAYRRMAGAMHYYALPTYVADERHRMNGAEATRLTYGHITRTAERECDEVPTDATLEEDDDGLWSIEVPMPSSASIDDLVAYESGASKVRVPIAERSISTDGLTATLRFYRPTLVKAATWAACGAERTPCDCSVEVASAGSFMDAVDVYYIQPISGTGIARSRTCSCSPVSSSTCANVEDGVLGWVRGATPVASCSCQQVSGATAYGSFYYTSGRWTRDTLPEDVKEGLFGAAICMMPEASMCQSSTRPSHMRTYRELSPSSAPGGMRPLGQVLMQAAILLHANGSGL